MPGNIITVFGARGSQGQSVVEALLRRKELRVRASTRNASSPQSKLLANAGCEVVEASYDNLDSLRRALQGAYGLWFITSFWDSRKGTVEAEVALGRNVAAAAKEAGIKHLVYSTLESPATASGLSFPVFDAKIGVEQEILYAAVPFTFVQVAWYFNNLENNHPNPHSGWYPWPRGPNGAYQLIIPIGPLGMHGIHSGDVGEACASIFEQPQRFIGSKVALSSEILTGDTMMDAFRGTFPRVEFAFVNPPIEEYKTAAPAGFGDALYRMFKWYQFRTPRGGDVALTHELNPQVRSFRAYLAEFRDRYKLEPSRS